MFDIYNRLLALDTSGKYYDYYPEHVINMDCFYSLTQTLAKLGKVDEYCRLYMEYFEEEITKVLDLKQGKLRPLLNSHTSFHLQVSIKDFITGLSTLDSNRAHLLLRTMDYLSKNRQEYSNFTEEEVNSSRDQSCFTIFLAPFVDLRCFFNALEILTIDEQKNFFVSLVHSDIKSMEKSGVISSFAEMLLEPNNMSHGEIVLMARAALAVYDDEALEYCRKFFKHLDIVTLSDFTMFPDI